MIFLVYFSSIIIFFEIFHFCCAYLIICLLWILHRCFDYYRRQFVGYHKNYSKLILVVKLRLHFRCFVSKRLEKIFQDPYLPTTVYPVRKDYRQQYFQDDTAIWHHQDEIQEYNKNPISRVDFITNRSHSPSKFQIKK